MTRRIRSTAVLTGLATAFVVAFAAGVHAQHGGPGPRGGFGRGGPGRGFAGLAALDLSDAQREQVRDVMQRQREEMREVGQRLHAAYDAQRGAIETVPTDEALVRSTSQALSSAQTEMAVLRARIHSEVWSLLTPEQQQKATELKAQRETWMKQRRERVQKRRQGQR